MKELDQWLAARYGKKFDPAAPACRMLARRLAGGITTDARGVLRIDPREWDRALPAYNNVVTLMAAIESGSGPAPYRAALSDWCAQWHLARGAPLDAERVRELASTVPGTARLLRLTGTRPLQAGLAGLDPRFAKRPPLSQKLILDGIARWNPWLQMEGSALVSAGGRAGGEGVAVPLRDGGSRVFFYRVTDRKAPIAVPPPEILERWTRGHGLLDLRDLHGLDLAALAGMAPEEIDLSYADVSDLAPLAKLSSIKRLRLRGLRLGDLSGLKGLRLEELDVSDSPVIDITPLTGMPLRKLDLTGTGVHDLTPLAGMPLHTLHIRSAPVRDISVLAGMPLREVTLSRRRYAGDTVLGKMEELGSVSDYGPARWFEAASSNNWPAADVGSARSELEQAARIELQFASSRGGHPCDSISVHLRWGAGGELRQAWLTEPPELNAPRFFDPVEALLTGDKLTCRAAVKVSRRESGQNRHYEFEIDVDIKDGSVSGAGVFRRYDSLGRNIDRGDVPLKVSGVLLRGPGDDPGIAGLLKHDWPTWRGASGGGRAEQPAEPIVSALSRARLGWVTDAGMPGSRAGDAWSAAPGTGAGISGGYASPILHGRRVYVYYYIPSGEAYDGRITGYHVGQHGHGRDKWRIEADDVVHCLDAGNGSTVWRRVFPRRGLNFNGFNSGAAAPMLTPCAAGGRVFAVGTGGRVYGLDAATGRVLWESTLGFRAQALEHRRRVHVRSRRLPMFGRDLGTSPIVADDVVVCSDHSAPAGVRRDRPSALLALETATGRVRWRVPDACGPTACPVRWAHGRNEYVLASSDRVRCVEARTGKVAWEIPGATYAVAPGLSGDTLICNGPSGEGITAWRLSHSGATKLWDMAGRYRLGRSAPIVASGQLIAALGDRLVGIDLVSGSVTGISTGSVINSSAHLTAMGNHVLMEGLSMFEVDQRGPRAVGGVWEVPYAKGVCPAAADGVVFFRSPRGVVCYDLRATGPAADEDVDMLLGMITAPDGQVRRNAARTLCTQRGAEGQEAVRQALSAWVDAGNAGAFNMTVSAILEGGVGVQARPIMAPAVLKALASENDQLFARAVREIMAVGEETRKKSIPTLVKYLKEGPVSRWSASTIAYMRIGPADRLHALMDMMIPELKSRDYRRRATAVSLMIDYGLRTKSKDHRVRLADGLFAAWRMDDYSDGNGFLVDTLCSIGRDASGIAPELKKLLYNKRIAPTVHRLLRAIEPGKAVKVGPGLDAEQDELELDIKD